MRIAYDLRPLQHANTPLRGIGSVIRCQIEALSRLDPDNEYLLLHWGSHPRPELDLAEGFRHAWVDVPRCRLSHATWLQDRVVLPSLLRGRVDVAHFLDPFNLHVGWTTRPRGARRTVVTVYDLMALTHGNVLLQGKRRLLSPVYRWMGERLRRADLLVCISGSTARDLAETLGPPLPEIRVALLGAVEAYRPRCEAEQAEACARLGIPRPFMLYVGALSPNKNLDRLLRVLDRLSRVPALVIVTSSPFAEGHPLWTEVQERLAAGRVHLLRSLPLEDLATVYSAARLTVLPSLGEGFGLPVAEAMACGTPVACSAIPALQETGGEACAFFDPRDGDSIATTLDTLWNDEPRRVALTGAGLERAASLRWSATARTLLDAYEDLARPGRS